MIIPLAGIALPLILVPAVMILKQVGRRRHYRHLERMEAIREGRPLTQSGLTPGPGSIVAIGAGVPIVAMGGALVITSQVSVFLDDALPVLAIVWACAGLISLCALATALILGMLAHRAHRHEVALRGDGSAKPAYDPDLFDAAGRGY